MARCREHRRARDVDCRYAPGYDIGQAQARIEESGYPFDVRYIQIPALAISSSNIRDRVRMGKSVHYLTSESVIGYIQKNGLYRFEGNECDA